jgi:hypothetical protein
MELEAFERQDMSDTGGGRIADDEGPDRRARSLAHGEAAAEPRISYHEAGLARSIRRLAARQRNGR